MQFGRCYEEFEVGALYKHWPRRTITESDDMLFCMLTMNHNPLHIDANYTENTEFKQPLVAVSLVFFILVGFFVGGVGGRAIFNFEFFYVWEPWPPLLPGTFYFQTQELDKKI